MATLRKGVWYTDLILEGVGRLNISLRTRNKEAAERRERILRRLADRGFVDVLTALKERRFSIVQLEAAYEEGPRAVRHLVDWKGDPRIEDLLPAFERDKGTEIKTASRYVTSLKHVLKWGPPGARISWLAKSETIERFKRERLANGYSPDTVNRDLAAISQFLIWHGGKRLARRAFDEVRWLRPKPRRTRRLTRDEIKRLLDRAWVEQGLGYRYPWHDIFLIMLGTGLRPGEVCRLRAHNVDLEQNVLRIEDSKTERGLREVPLEGEPLEVLARLKKEAKAPDALLFPGLGHIAIAKALRRIAERANIKNIVPRDLRRTHAQYCRLAERDIVAVRDQLGHTTSLYTDRYVGESQADERRSMVQGALEMMGLNSKG